MKPRCKRIDILNAVVYDIHLSASMQFPKHRFSHHFLVKLGYFRVNWQPISGGRINNREITSAHEGEMQCARDRCRSECQRVDICSQCTQLLLRRNSEALLFIDD